MLRVLILSDIMLSIIMLNVILMIVLMLSVVHRNAIMLRVIILSYSKLSAVMLIASQSLIIYVSMLSIVMESVVRTDVSAPKIFFFGQI